MSRHLKVLRTRGLIEDERSPEDARMRVYALRRERFDTLQGWLDEVQAFWTEQLDAFKAHAEGARDRGPSGRGRGPGRPRRRNPRKRT